MYRITHCETLLPTPPPPLDDDDVLKFSLRYHRIVRRVECRDDQGGLLDESSVSSVWATYTQQPAVSVSPKTQKYPCHSVSFCWLGSGWSPSNVILVSAVYAAAADS